MEKEKRVQLKLMGIALGLLIILVVVAVQFFASHRADKKEAYIRVEDASILLKALLPEFEASAVYEEWNAFGSQNEYLTYAQLELLSELPAYTLPLSQLSDTYKSKEQIKALDWYALFDVWRTLYDTEGTIREDEITVLGLGNQILKEGGVPMADGALLSAAGYLYAYENSAFADTVYRKLRVLRKEDRLLSVLSTQEEEIQLKNMWLKDAADEEIRIFLNGYDLVLPKDGKVAAQKEQVADITIQKDGSITSIVCKTDKYSGKLLRMTAEGFEIEGHGKLAFTEDMKVYRLFGTLKQCRKEDLIIGYDFADFVIEDGKICAALIARDGAMENIRVLLRDSGFAGLYHEAISLTSDTDFDVIYGEQTATHPAGEQVTFAIEDMTKKEERIVVRPKALTGKILLSSLSRTKGVPSYRGSLEIEKTEEGFVIVNELLLEEYLYAVVPSEMPANYPPEALKAQAVCARTYAYGNLLKAGLGAFGAHVDDSTSYQVYNNIEENMASTEAVKSTKGQIMYYGEILAGTYYYSTSCGYGTNACVWNADNAEAYPYLQAAKISSASEGNMSPEQMQEEADFAAYITGSNESDYEKTEGWYRWSYTQEHLDAELLQKRLRERFSVNPNHVLTKTDAGYEAIEITDLGSIRNIYVTKRLAGGVIDELVMEGSKAEIKVISEYNVRYLLSDAQTKVIRQDGSESGPSALLPSAFLIIQPTLDKNEVVGYSIIGGGYGHGVGMSQNGAKNMAIAGIPYPEILTFFYQGTKIKTAY